MPPAKILSVEQVGDITFAGEDSVLNRLSDEERAHAVNDLTGMARKSGETSGLTQDADTQVRSRLQELLNKDGQSVHFQWSMDTDKPGIPLP